MLRSLVLVLLLANAGFYAWSHHGLDRLIGVPADAQREPQRLSRQVHADQLIVLPAPGGASRPALPLPTAAQAASDAASGVQASATTVSSGAATPPGRTLCIEAGPFTPAEHEQVNATLAPILTASQWTTETVAVPGTWLVYMGPYADADTLARKLAELKRIRGLTFEEIDSPAGLAHGLALGRYGRLDDADAALRTLKLRGIRTARIVTLRAPVDLELVRVAQADGKTQVALSAVKLPQGKGFAACRL